MVTLVGGKISATDTAYLVDKATTEAYPPRIAAFGDKAYAAVSSLKKIDRLGLPSEVLGTTHADFLAATATLGTLIVAPDNSPADVLLSKLGSATGGSLQYDSSAVTIDPTQGISPTLKALLDNRSANIDELDIVDATGKLSADTVKQISALIAGPLGVQTMANQPLDDVLKAQKKQ